MKLMLLLATATLMLTACGNTGSADSSSEESVQSRLLLDRFKAAQAVSPVSTTQPGATSPSIDCTSPAATSSYLAELEKTMQDIMADVSSQNTSGVPDLSNLQGEIQQTLTDMMTEVQNCIPGGLAGLVGTGTPSAGTTVGTNGLPNGLSGVNVPGLNGQGTTGAGNLLGNGSGFNLSGLSF